MTDLLLAPDAVSTIPEPGWYEDVPMDVYQRIPAMSASGMEAFRRSPAHYRYQQTHPKEPTPAMREGTALHMALLEPERFAGRYITLGRCEGIKKDGAQCTSQGSVYRSGQSFCGTHDPQKGQPIPAGIEVLAEEALARIEGMRLAVLAHPEASEFFRGRGRSELTGIWIDEATGVRCKIRPDREIARAWIHSDLKSTTDASDEGFARQIGRMGYHRKSAFYRRGMEALGRPATASVLIAAESQPPHGVNTFLLDEDQLRLCGPEIDRNLRVLAECLETGDWPGYPTGLRVVKVKPWDLPGEAIIEEYDPDADEEL